jgi:hypothetical protein
MARHSDVLRLIPRGAGHSRAPGFAIALFLLWRPRANFAGLLKT